MRGTKRGATPTAACHQGLLVFVLPSMRWLYYINILLGRVHQGDLRLVPFRRHIYWIQFVQLCALPLNSPDPTSVRQEKEIPSPRLQQPLMAADK